jgi:ketosteroid isomerase-like protein
MTHLREFTYTTCVYVFPLICVLLISAAPSRLAAAPDSQAIAQLWVQRLAATMEEHASSTDIDRLLEMYADDAVYEHPQTGARVEGKSELRKGISSHLGETRAPKIEITQSLTGDGFAVVELILKMDVRQDSQWVAIERRQVVVLELKNSRIQRIIDHWSRLTSHSGQGTLMPVSFRDFPTLKSVLWDLTLGTLALSHSDVEGKCPYQKPRLCAFGSRRIFCDGSRSLDSGSARRSGMLAYADRSMSQA